MQIERERKGTVERLLQAFKENQFVLYRQAIQPLAANPSALPYQEIFVRFVEEDEKLLPPGTFIPILEHFDLMGILDRWVVNRVVAWLRGAQDRQGGARFQRCSVNLSPGSVQDLEVARYVQKQLNLRKVPPAALSFEITEADLAENATSVLEVICLLKPLGCGFALSGYTGTLIACDALKPLGVDTVKIDGNIVRGIGRDPPGRVQAKQIIEKCRELAITTVGELVETPEMLANLKLLGADYGQGFAIDVPRPLDNA